MGILKAHLRAFGSGELITIIRSKIGKILGSGAIRQNILFALPKKVSSKMLLTKTKIVHVKAITIEYLLLYTQKKDCAQH